VLLKESKYEIERTKPVNLNSEDSFLFENEYKRTFNVQNIIFKKNVYVYNSRLFKFKYINFYSNHWRMTNFWISQKIQLFLNNIKNLFFEKKILEIEIISKASWVLDQKSWKYMHWFSDVLQRIDRVENNLKEYPVLIFKDYLNYEYISETLNKLNFPFIVIDKNKKYLIKNLLISPHPAPSGNYIEPLIKNISKKLKKEFKNEKNHEQENRLKIWVSRQEASIRKEKNFKELSVLLKKFGFQIVNFEKLNFSEQVKLASNSVILAGLHGAGLTNMIFMNEGTSVLEVRSSIDFKNNCYFSLASALNINYFYSKAYVKNKFNEVHSGEYDIDLVMLEENIKKILTV